MALLSKDAARPGVSVEMNQTFCSAAKIGDLLDVRGAVIRYGKTLGFTEVTISVRPPDATDGGGAEGGGARPAGRVVATGRHTKFFAPAGAAPVV